MTNYKATPEQWEADRYDWSQAGSEAMTGDSAFRCILELRARVEALEAQVRNYPETPDNSTPPPVAADEELLKIWNSERACRPWVSRRAIYDLGVAHGQASSREVAELRTELERERIRLAVCGVVAKADTLESAKRARDMHPDYHSASLDDVISMVDALMDERAKQAHGREVADPAPVAPVARGLVKQVKLAIDSALYAEDDHPWNEARAAILEVAKWLRKQGAECSADLLEQEAGR